MFDLPKWLLALAFFNVLSLLSSVFLLFGNYMPFGYIENGVVRVLAYIALQLLWVLPIASFFAGIMCYDYGHRRLGPLILVAGNLLPLVATSALSVALYGMFIWVIIPPAKQDHMVAALIAVSFAASWLAANLPVVADISSGTRTIILTLVLAGLGAWLKPVADEPELADSQPLADETATGYPDDGLDAEQGDAPAPTLYPATTLSETERYDLNHDNYRGGDF